MTVDCYVFKYYRRSVNRKHFKLFQGENDYFNLPWGRIKIVEPKTRVDYFRISWSLPRKGCILI